MSTRTRKTRKGEPFSIRLSAPTDDLVADEARRSRRSKSSIVEELTEESARMRRFPGIGFRDEYPRRRPWVIGTGLDVWELIDLLESYGSTEAVVRDFPLVTERHVRLAAAYRDAHPEEIDEAIAENRRPADELQRLHPFVRLGEHAR
ncbi:MAG TPA: DUF433 domain-containing protein [Gaiellaceae bacterium]|jgi:uncharacterized protein (DUF433 family)